MDGLLEPLGNVLSASLSAPVLPYSILLGILVPYWAMVIIGVLDMDSADADADFDAQAELDADADLDLEGDLATEADGDFQADAHVAGDGGPAAGHGWLMSVLGFMNAGDVPLMMVLSILVLGMWGIGMSVTIALGLQGWLASALLLAPNLLAGALLTRLITTPLKSVFRRSMRDGSALSAQHLIGKVCRVVSPKADTEYGRAQVDTHGAPLIINIRTREGREIARGEEAVIYRYDGDSGIYYVDKTQMEGLD